MSACVQVMEFKFLIDLRKQAIVPKFNSLNVGKYPKVLVDHKAFVVKTLHF